ncbi:hypothetical protein EMIHUDRAFT_201153 [Emiliania huxleyi CCMP1516]|uniref:RING-type domain-containing protein n=2 Tax=Emiliania huxleyi TaxID=2903 RepID=A0A0D3KM90_EMIH1|nr:hypothetical protein EMIHUDRAFT_201153 [Emiliania huxleyi CCMP1516]EOD36875.1 hypothetical protein EMIHUDRAFT_201153 [Emiliania huxleyi CCMP1516]|eukprot:XP_005789304.1 hypothetical protein EMIHUDRAFT_201153 [Emiliania huxleyi CCMP1516]
MSAECTQWHRQDIQNLLKKLRLAWKDLRIESKLKLLIGFVQVVAPMGAVYSITMPDSFRAFLEAMEAIYIDIFGPLFVPTKCLGGLFNLLLLKGFVPIGLLLFVWLILSIVRLRSERRSERRSANGDAVPPLSPWRAVVHAVRSSLRLLLPATLWMIVIFCTSVSASVFSAFHCRRFVVNTDMDTREFLRASLDIECPGDGREASPEYHELQGLAWALIVLWPIGSLLGLAALFLSIRGAVMHRKPNKWSRAAGLLTRDFKAEFYWWEWLELVRRLLLTGFVLAIPESAAFLRLAVALVVSVLFLISQMLLVPYKAEVIQFLSCAAQLVIIVLLIGSTFMYLHEQFSVAIASAAVETGDTDPVVSVLVFESLENIAVLCFAAMAVLALGLSALTVRSMVLRGKDELLRLKATKARPQVSIARGLKYHLFLSHIWGTGQDQVAVIKRQLLRMVPDLVIFLDVDDLEDIGNLEGYIDETMAVLMFLSRGYFTSRNCLREVRSTAERKLPVILVHERDVNKGGLPYEASMDECPEDLREFVFGKEGAMRDVLEWHRVTVFQLCTLKEIARVVLDYTPLYLDDQILDVYLKTDCEVEDLTFASPVAAYASPNNVGCRRAIRELAKTFRSSDFFVRLEPPAEWVDPAVLARRRLEEGEGELGGASAGSNVSLSGTGTGSGPGRVPRNLEKRRQIFLLYLNRNTWHGAAGVELAAEVRLALEIGAEIVMLHENDPERDGCEFGHFFGTTPVDLINNGLFKPLAVALMTGPHRRVSLSLAAQAMGATRKRVAKRMSFHRSSSGSADDLLDADEERETETTGGTDNGQGGQGGQEAESSVGSGLWSRARGRLAHTRGSKKPVASSSGAEQAHASSSHVALDVSGTAGSSVEQAGKVCVVCLSGPRTHAVKPCRHLCLCPDCAATALKDLDTFSQCPICRADMDGVMRIYEP